MRHVLLPILTTLLLACGPKVPSSTAPAAGPSAEAPAPATAQTLPTPYSAEQIRDAMPVGRTMHFKLEKAGQPPVELRWKVTASDANGCTIHEEIVDPSAGAPVAPGDDSTHAWEELRQHAAFPAQGTVVSQREIDAPMGRLRVDVYRVSEDAAVTEYSFAPDMPGPPVLMVVTAGDQEVMRMTMLERGQE